MKYLCDHKLHVLIKKANKAAYSADYQLISNNYFLDFKLIPLMNSKFMEEINND